MKSKLLKHCQKCTVYGGKNFLFGDAFFLLNLIKIVIKLVHEFCLLRKQSLRNGFATGKKFSSKEKRTFVGGWGWNSVKIKCLKWISAKSMLTVRKKQHG